MSTQGYSGAYAAHVTFDRVATQAQILAEVAPLVERFEASGLALFLVGGIVRDLDLGVVNSLDEGIDIDLTTPATPDEILSIVSPLADDVWTQGKRFGTIGCRIGGRTFEITTHRADSYSADSRKPEVQFGDRIEDDLARRDFTINAMAIRLPGGERVDPFDGGRALSDRVLETPIDPNISLIDDPLRVLRAARFMAKLELAVAPELTAAAIEQIDRLSIVSVERIRDELDKLLSLPRPSAGVQFLVHVGALKKVFPSVDWDSLGSLPNQLDALDPSLDARRLLFFLVCSETSSEDLLAGLKYSNDEVSALRSHLRACELLLEFVDDGAGDHRPVTNAEVRRLVDTAGLQGMDLVFAALGVTSPELPVTAFRDRLDELAKSEDLSSFDPVMSGGELIEQLALEPGPVVGRVMAALRERRIELGPATAEDELAFSRTLVEWMEPD